MTTKKRLETEILMDIDTDDKVLYNLVKKHNYANVEAVLRHVLSCTLGYETSADDEQTAIADSMRNLHYNDSSKFEECGKVIREALHGIGRPSFYCEYYESRKLLHIRAGGTVTVH